MPDDLELYIGDLKVLGRREFQHLLRMKNQFQILTKQNARDLKNANKPAFVEKEKTEEEMEAELEKELDETISRMDAETKRKAKKENVLAKKSEERKKMSVIVGSTIENDEDLFLSRKMWDKVREKGFDKVGEKSDDDEPEADSSSEESESESDSASDESIDANVAQVEDMAE